MSRRTTSALRVLVVEDDHGDALLVGALLEDALSDVGVTFAGSLAEAVAAAPESPSCVLLDLGLPDASGLMGVERLSDAWPDAAIVVLTGANDEDLGVAALAAGAQDYLVKGRVDAEVLGRSVRYAVERQQADAVARELWALEQRRAENYRLERGLLPRPVLSRFTGRIHVRYRPGSEGAQLGGDFYDAVEAEDGSLHVMIGDVAGHGPDEAALGVCLRVAWRALTLTGLTEEEILRTVEAVLASEREHDDVFATLCHLTCDADGVVRAWSAGHPPPMLIVPRCEPLTVRHGPLLGVIDGATWSSSELDVPPGAAVLLYTDGLIEGLASTTGTRDRLGVEGVCELGGDLPWTDDPEGALDELLERVEARNGGPLQDDVALCLVQWPDP